MTLTETLSILASIISIVSGPASLYFAWRASKKATQAVAGAEELAKRMTSRRLYDHQGKVLTDDE